MQRDDAPPAAPTGLIVDDDATEVGFTQLRKTDFVGRTRIAVQTTVAAVPGVDPAVASAELDKRAATASTQKAQKIEADIKSQVPGARFVPTAGGYVPLIAAFAAAQAATADETGPGTTPAAPQADSSGAPPTVSRQVDDDAPAVSRLWSGWRGPVRLKARESGHASTADTGILRDRMGEGSGLGGAQAPMESAFGTSFDSVRIHTGPGAAQAADDLGARAFTIGDHIAFGGGEYQPGSPAGDALLAHELAHTVQQRDSGDIAARSAAPVEAGSAESEMEADHSAMRVVSRLWTGMADGLQSLSGAMPRLRTGLRLNCCKRSKCCDIPAPTGALKIVEPDHDCKPFGEDRNSVFAVNKPKDNPLAKPTEYGKSNVQFRPDNVMSFINPESIAPDRKCPDLVKPTSAGGQVPRLSIGPFVYVKAGRYEDPPRLVAASRCSGKKPPKGKKNIEVPVVEVISEKLSDRFRAAEVEHCEDYSRAWRMTYGRYLGAILELKDGFCVEGLDDEDAGSKAIRQQEYQKRLQARSGFASDKDVAASFECLATQTSDRDTKRWHTAKAPKEERAADCSVIELVETEDKPLPQVGLHPSSELVNGCGVAEGADAGT